MRTLLSIDDCKTNACILRRNNQDCVHGAATSRQPLVMRSPCGARGSMSLLDRLARRTLVLYYKMAGSAVNFVNIIEQYPCLYNNKLPEYSRKDVTDRAWSEVAQKTNTSGK